MRHARSLAATARATRTPGLRAPSSAYGISARIAQLNAFDILNGHIAGWFGVGGTGEGPHGSNESLRVGSAGFPGITGSDIYYEVALPGTYPTYHEVFDRRGGRRIPPR